MVNIALFAAAAAPLDPNAGPIQQILDTFGVTLPTFIAQCISFAIVAFLLNRFAYKPILKVLDERRDKIEAGLKNAEKIQAELAETEAARQKVLDEANAQANKMIEEARESAERVRETETQKAIAEAEGIITKAREAAEQDRVRMLAELKQEVGRLVVQTTGQVTGKVLTPEDQQRLADEAKAQVAA